eukprot:TRINITY_DN48047_c0_g2_i1.p1 TRINITY_DN48047_c0_g2~~TRINITY_DN48047_c0_g2_i1.p1  ORF type:complete len:335 (+),score=31.91 TRINITY_DN48047_c0_g2_i1:154-1158(+)
MRIVPRSRSSSVGLICTISILVALASSWICIASPRVVGTLVSLGRQGRSVEEAPASRSQAVLSPTAEERNAKLEIETFSSRSPFVVAFCIFFMQSFGGALCLLVMLFRGSDTEDTARIRDSITAFSLIALSETLVYGLLTVNPDHFFGESVFWVNFLEDGGPHILGRNLQWLLSTPLQWYCFARSCTQASPEQTRRLVVNTIMMQVVGLFSMLSVNLLLRYTMFAVSSFFLVLMFREAHKIPVPDEMRSVSRMILHLDIAVWNGYPLAVMLRFAGVISPWTEQVVAYTVLDILAKSVSITGIIATQLTMVLSKISEAARRLEAQNAQKSNGHSQ